MNTALALACFASAAILATVTLKVAKQVKLNNRMIKNLRKENAEIEKMITEQQQLELDKLIAETKGKFFSITFTKKDGTVRVINGKDKYDRLLKGGESYSRASGYVPFVNRNTETWACARGNTLLKFKCGKSENKIA
jgi:hypothetical protein